MAVNMLKLMIDPNLVVLVLSASLYVDSVSDGNHFCESLNLKKKFEFFYNFSMFLKFSKVCFTLHGSAPHVGTISLRVEKFPKYSKKKNIRERIKYLFESPKT